MWEFFLGVLFVFGLVLAFVGGTIFGWQLQKQEARREAERSRYFTSE